MRKIDRLGLILFTILVGMLLLPSCAQQQTTNYLIAPARLPNTTAAMQTPGFWIARHPYPDSLLMTPAQIDSLNNYMCKELRTITVMGVYPDSLDGNKIVASLLTRVLNFQNRNLLDPSGKKLTDDYYTALQEEMNLYHIPKVVQASYGFLVNYADQRIFPTTDNINAKPFDVEFDEFQNSAYDAGTPIAILHMTADRSWAYTANSLSSGWVDTKSIAFCSKQALRQFSEATDFVVITIPKADIYGDASLTKQLCYVRMGMRFPVSRQVGTDIYEILFPQRDQDSTCEMIKAYVRADAVHRGYLPYTPRNIYEQAFKMLNAPYGWGDMFGEQDCSRFLVEIFNTVGIQLPRNGASQQFTGKEIKQFKGGESDTLRASIIAEKGVGAITTMRLNGHIMLYLGSINGNPYAIHDLWAYREPTKKGDVIRVTNKAIVSDLTLGKGSKRGSLLERLVMVRAIQPE